MWFPRLVASTIISCSLVGGTLLPSSSNQVTARDEASTVPSLLTKEMMIQYDSVESFVEDFNKVSKAQLLLKDEKAVGSGYVVGRSIVSKEEWKNPVYQELLDWQRDEAQKVVDAAEEKGLTVEMVNLIRRSLDAKVASEVENFPGGGRLVGGRIVSEKEWESDVFQEFYKKHQAVNEETLEEAERQGVAPTLVTLIREVYRSSTITRTTKFPSGGYIVGERPVSVQTWKNDAFQELYERDKEEAAKTLEANEEMWDSWRRYLVEQSTPTPDETKTSTPTETPIPTPDETKAPAPTETPTPPAENIG